MRVDLLCTEGPPLTHRHALRISVEASAVAVRPLLSGPTVDVDSGSGPWPGKPRKMAKSVGFSTTCTNDKQHAVSQRENGPTSQCTATWVADCANVDRYVVVCPCIFVEPNA